MVKLIADPNDSSARKFVGSDPNTVSGSAKVFIAALFIAPWVIIPLIACYSGHPLACLLLFPVGLSQFGVARSTSSEIDNKYICNDCSWRLTSSESKTKRKNCRSCTDLKEKGRIDSLVGSRRGRRMLASGRVLLITKWMLDWWGWANQPPIEEQFELIKHLQIRERELNSAGSLDAETRKRLQNYIVRKLNEAKSAAIAEQAKQERLRIERIRALTEDN